jgi:hypothetical protein
MGTVAFETSEFLQPEDEVRLARVLGCVTDQEAAERVSGVARAAFSDYVEMLLGSALPNRAEEIRERRLLYLLRHYAREGELLTEIQIAAMFQLNESESRRLLRGVRSRFKSELDARVSTAIVALLESATKPDEDSFRVQLTSDNLLEALRMAVTINAPQLDQIVKVRGSAGLYDIPVDTYTELCREFSANPSS